MQNEDQAERSAAPKAASTDVQPVSSTPSVSAKSPSEPRYKLAGEFPYGIDIWVPCPDADVDICFIHGLTGSRDSTWTAEGQTEPWPKRFLPDEFKSVSVKARIFAYGYDAYPVRWGVASTKRLTEHAESFLGALTANRARENASDRPLIFVAHSLGGLVCKEVILLAKDSPEPHHNILYHSVKGIVFMGTPHNGSPIANWAHIPATVFGLVKSTNENLLRILKMNDEMLDSVNTTFLFMLRKMRENSKHGLKCTCFYETKPFPAVGVIVPKSSAVFESDPAQGIDANHSDMVKFASPRDPGYLLVFEELRRWSAEVKAHSAERGTRNRITYRFDEDVSEESRSHVSHEIPKSDVHFALYVLQVPRSPSTYDAMESCIGFLDLQSDLKFLQKYRKRTLGPLPEYVKEVEERIRKAYKENKNKLLLSLSFESMMDRGETIESAAPATCQWIYQDKAYLRWRENECALLWIKGRVSKRINQ